MQLFETNKERVILLVDCNSFYASAEIAYRPELRGKAVAVGGDPEARHGIILTATPPAKKCGVSVGMALWEAKKACPGLIIVPPNYELYEYLSMCLNEMYYSFTPRVQMGGLDESWLEITQPGLTIQDGARLADYLREEIKYRYGITVSIGVSWSRILAKLASELKKPDATNVISPDNYEKIVSRLPASDLMYVEPSRTKRLYQAGILSISDLANASFDLMEALLGKVGIMLKIFAMGADPDRVSHMHVDHVPVPFRENAPGGGNDKSIGNSMTTPFDIATLDDAKAVFSLLSDSVGTRVRKGGYRARTISIFARTTGLDAAGCQRTIARATTSTRVIYETGMQLFVERYARSMPMRSVGIRCMNLEPDTHQQLTMFDDSEKQRRFDDAVDTIHRRFGKEKLQSGAVFTRPVLLGITPLEEYAAQDMAAAR